MIEGTVVGAEFCTLKEAAARFGLDARGVYRLRKHLQWKKVRWKHGRGWLYRLADVERAVTADRAYQAAGEIDSTMRCPSCEVELVRLWFVDRCPGCGVPLRGS